VQNNKFGILSKILFLSVPFLFLFFIVLLAELILRMTMPDLRYYHHAKKTSGGIAYELNSLGHVNLSSQFESHLNPLQLAA
jgi:hypothetical protein